MLKKYAQSIFNKFSYLLPKNRVPNKPNCNPNYSDAPKQCPVEALYSTWCWWYSLVYHVSKFLVQVIFVEPLHF